MLDLKHKKLDVWKLSVEFTKLIYTITEEFPKTEVFGISNQLRRASVSDVSNISEGASRKSSMERKRFFMIARSSLVEIDSQLEVCIALKFIKIEETQLLSEMVNHLFAMLTNLISKS